jgi:hypothetical protein
LVEWIYADKSESSDLGNKEAAQKRFLHAYAFDMIDQKISKMNWTLQGIWDLPRDLHEPHLVTEMILALPEFAKFRQTALKVIQQDGEDVSEF